MAFEVITTNPGTDYNIDSDDNVVLSQNVIFTSLGDGFNAVSSGGGLLFNNISLQIFGQVYSGARAIDFWGSLGGTTSYNFNEIWIASTGVLSGVTFGIRTESGEGNSIINYGQIVGDIGIETYGGVDHSIVNGGSITGLNGAAIQVIAEVDATGFNNCAIINQATGVIQSDNGAGISLEMMAGGSRVNNLGLISSTFAVGINLENVNAGQTIITTVNQGTIAGGQASFRGSANADALTNRGLMVGDVLLGDGDDVLNNRNGGTVEGAVQAGLGDDVLNTLTGTVTGLIDMGDGDDRVVGNAAADEIIEGGLGVDILDFRFGAAVRVALDLSFDGFGAALGDSYTGFERVLGSAFADVLRGDSASNVLVGNAGADALDGADGADLLRGATGVDTLTGGLGNDTFRFNNLAECDDLITDFRNVAGDNDRFQIIAAEFGGGLAAGTLAANQFRSRADNLAQDADDRFVFRTTDRTLWFDADGTGAGAALMVADLQAGATMSAADFQLI